MTQLVDLNHHGVAGVMAAYVVDHDGLAVIDCGPGSCADQLEAGLEAGGIRLGDIGHLLLTHIHPDHAGGAGELVRRHPGLTVHVHEIGAPHLVDPSRLVKSASRLYGDQLVPLFGEILPVPEGNVRVLGDAALGFEVIAAPGHASHQVAFLDETGACYPGDAVGVLLRRGGFLYPAAAPPEIDMAEWQRTLDELERRDITVFRLPHFGEVTNVGEHLCRVRERLTQWGSRIEGGESEADFVAAARRALAAEAPPDMVELFPKLPYPSFAQSFAGVKRYYDKRQEVQAGATG